MVHGLNSSPEIAIENGTSLGSAEVGVRAKASGVLQAILVYDKIWASTIAKLAGVPNLHLGVTPSSAMNPYP